jgi:hypothetical protein
MMLVQWLLRLRIPQKFGLALFAILVVPVSIAGFLMYQQLTRAAMQQERLTLIRSVALARQSVLAKLSEVERTGALVATNAKINEFLDAPFHWDTAEYETYAFLVAPALENFKFLNKALSDLRVYYYEPTIPEQFGNGGFYSFARIAAEPWLPALREALDHGSLWREGPAPDDHTPKLNVAGARPPFEYYSQIRSLLSGEERHQVRKEGPRRGTRGGGPSYTGEEGTFLSKR